MSLEEKLLGRIDALIAKADRVRNTHKELPPGVITSVTLDAGAFVEWQAQTLSFLTNLLGSEHVNVERFTGAVRKASSSDVKKGQGILRAVREDVEGGSVREDVEGGYLTEVRTLVSAEVFTDFLEMAEHLHNNGYKDPAASLTGAVLEDGLRRIAEANNIKLRAREDLSSPNSKLVNAAVYNNLSRKQVQVWIDVRNSADHAQFEQYGADDVEEMISGVQKFLADYL